MCRVLWMLAILLVAVRTESIDDIDEEAKIQLKLSASEAGIDSHEIDLWEVLRAGQPDGPDPKPGGGFSQISCYTCTNCKDLLLKTPVVKCPYSEDTAKMHKCITYVEKYNFLDKPWYIRGCATKVGSCEEVKTMHDDMKDRKLSLRHCYECEGDMCNGVSISHSFPLAFLILSPFLLKLFIS